MRPTSSPINNVSEEQQHEFLLAGFYGLILRRQGYSIAAAAKLVIQRYPGVRPQIEGLTREVVDPLAPKSSRPELFLVAR